MQVRSDREESLKRVLTAACRRASLVYSENFIETPVSEGRSDSSARAFRKMIQRPNESVNALGITFTIKHSPLAQLVRHSEWILNHLVHTNFPIELDDHAIETTPL